MILPLDLVQNPLCSATVSRHVVITSVHRDGEKQRESWGSSGLCWGAGSVEGALMPIKALKSSIIACF